MRDWLHDDAGPSRRESAIDLTPMLDVVFIMLIFFIVTASFVKESGFDVNRPPPGQQPPPGEQQRNILVTIAGDGRLYVDGRPVDPAALVANLKRLHAERPQARVVIRAQDEARNALLVAVMDAARQAGVDIALAAD